MLFFISAYHAGYFHVLHSSPIFYPIDMEDLSFEHHLMSRVENSVDADQLASLRSQLIRIYAVYKTR